MISLEGRLGSSYHEEYNRNATGISKDTERSVRGLGTGADRTDGAARLLHMVDHWAPLLKAGLLRNSVAR